MTDGKLLLRQLNAEYAALALALSEENRLATLTCHYGEDEAIYRQWAYARRRVEECRDAYDAVLDACKGRCDATVTFQRVLSRSTATGD
jgi:hypothetical protein